jgi:hypothetical protein
MPRAAAPAEPGQQQNHNKQQPAPGEAELIHVLKSIGRRTQVADWACVLNGAGRRCCAPADACLELLLLLSATPPPQCRSGARMSMAIAGAKSSSSSSMAQLLRKTTGPPRSGVPLSAACSVV